MKGINNMIINVPVVNESPNVLTISFESEYAVPFEVANPDGIPAHCQPGGAGVLGGPEFVNLLQRTSPSTIQYTGYACESFQLSAHPGYTFFSFDNFVTGKKNVVAFNDSVAYTPLPTSVFTVSAITASATAVHSATGLTASVTAVPDAVSYVWSGTAIGTITSGANTNSITYTAAATTGATTLICTVTDDIGYTVASPTFTVTLS